MGAHVPRIDRISAITLAVSDMARSVAFYEALGFTVDYGGRGAAFTTLCAGDGALNLERRAEALDMPPGAWGRVIWYVDDVDALHRVAVEAGLQPAFAPRDAPWGERYFHLVDPDGHELSFAHPIER